jgi:ricin-type beta-trefoil lectin protein
MPIPIGRLIQIVNYHSGKCLDVPNGSVLNDVAIQQYQCHRGLNQRWIIEQLGYGYRIRNAHSGLVLAPSNMPGRENALTQQSPAEVQLTTRPQWNFSPTGATYSILNVAYSGKCMDVPNGSVLSGVQIQLYPSHGGLNQLWWLME